MNFNNVKFIRSATDKSQFLTDLREVVFVGRSNVGKSSLINRILNRKNFARTSSSPGKTAVINYFEVDKTIYLVDLPGYGYAKVSKAQKEKWGAFIDDYFNISKNIAFVVMIVDIRHNPSADDIIMAKYLMALKINFLVVASKADKIAKSKIEESINNIKALLGLYDNIKIIPFSSISNIGRGELVEIIAGVGEDQA